MKVNKMDHISVAVNDLECARKIWEPVFGKSGPDDRYEDELEKIRVARYQFDGIAFELIESMTPDGPVAKWIGNHGEGVMLISFNVDNTRSAIGELENKNYSFLPNPVPLDDDATGKARPFRNGEFAFLHPKIMNGTLVEIIDDEY